MSFIICFPWMVQDHIQGQVITLSYRIPLASFNLEHSHTFVFWHWYFGRIPSLLTLLNRMLVIWDLSDISWLLGADLHSQLELSIGDASFSGYYIWRYMIPICLSLVRIILISQSTCCPIPPLRNHWSLFSLETNGLSVRKHFKTMHRSWFSF